MICETCINYIDLQNNNVFDSNFYCKYRKEELIYYDGNCDGYIKKGDVE